MGKTINGTNRGDLIRQSDFLANSSLVINGFNGADTIVLDRNDDLGGDNRVNAGGGKDTVFNDFEGGNVILMGGGNDTYVGTGFSLLGGRDGVDGGTGNDRFFVATQKSIYLGNVGDDYFASHGWENTFDGGTGNDTISYEFRHEDTVIGDTGVVIDLFNGVVQTGNGRTEAITNFENAVGSIHGDILGGTNDGNFLAAFGGGDEIHGFGGADVLLGGAGQDALFGGADADRFVFQSTTDSATFAGDFILDFDGAEGDVIDLSAIDANSRFSGNQAFSFIGSGGFSGQGGEVRFANSQLTVDTNGDRIADMVINLTGVTGFDGSDLVL